MARIKKNRGLYKGAVAEVWEYFSESLFSEKYSGREGLLQSFPAILKIIFLVLIVVLISFIHEPYILLSFYFLSLLLAYFSKIDLGYFVKKGIVFIPLFSFVIAIPAIFNIFVPGEVVVTLFKLGQGKRLGPILFPAEITITRQGLLSASTFVLRVLSSVSFVMLIKVTTSFEKILSALNKILPSSSGYAMGISYRYLKILIAMVADMNMARKSRNLGYKSKFFSQSMAASGFLVFKKSVFLAENVYKAMSARGWDGKF